MDTKELKEWLDTELSFIKQEVADTKAISLDNAEQLKIYKYTWKGIRIVGYVIMAILTFRWGDVKTLLH